MLLLKTYTYNNLLYLIYCYFKTTARVAPYKVDTTTWYR